MFHVKVFNERMMMNEEFPVIETVSEVACEHVDTIVKIIGITAQHATDMVERTIEENTSYLYVYDSIFVTFSGGRLKGTIEFKIV